MALRASPLEAEGQGTRVSKMGGGEANQGYL